MKSRNNHLERCWYEVPNDTQTIFVVPLPSFKHDISTIDISSIMKDRLQNTNDEQSENYVFIGFNFKRICSTTYNKI